MPKRLQFETDTHYHVYNRGLNKQTLFHDATDFQKFLDYLDFYKQKCKKDLAIIGYCLLPNHFHVIIHNNTDGHKISYLIGNICASYARYYKAKYVAEKGRSCFEYRFRTKGIKDPESLCQHLYYIENNPLKHGLVYKPEHWIYKSNISDLSSQHEHVHIEWDT